MKRWMERLTLTIGLNDGLAARRAGAPVRLRRYPICFVEGAFEHERVLTRTRRFLRMLACPASSS